MTQKEWKDIFGDNLVSLLKENEEPHQMKKIPTMS